MSRSSLKWMSRVVLLFGVLCYLTSCAMETGRGPSLQEQLPAQGGTVGPFAVEAGGTVLEIDVAQQIDQARSSTFRRWSFVTGELLDEEQQYLTGFGGEFWHEAGYDGGYWREEEATYETKLTVPEAGRYYLRFQSESDVPAGELSPIRVRAAGQLGSSLPHRVAAFLAFVVGGGLWWFARVRPSAQRYA